MSDLELQLNTDSLQLSFGEHIHTTAEKIADLSVQKNHDAEMRRTYVNLLDYGVELMYENDQLTNATLFLVPYKFNKKYSGAFLSLSSDFFSSPNEAKFSDAMEIIGMKKFWKKYPFAVDYVRDGLRVGYFCSPDSSYINIDDGSRLPKEKTTRV